MLHAKNNSKRLKDELRELRHHNKPLLKLVLDLYKWVDKELSKDVILTMIFRTPKEQDYLYRNSGRYKNKPFKSPHQFWHGLDIRSRVYTDDERSRITTYLNNKYDSSNYYKWTAKVHKVGNGAFHFHIQYYKK